MTKYLTQQEIFDRAATHLIKQGVKSETDGRCAYRANGYYDSAVRCAIGIFIPDELYQNEFEGKNSMDLPDDCMPEIDNNGDTEYLLTNLQSVHDCFEPIEWRDRLRAIALNFDLSSDCITKEKQC